LHPMLTTLASPLDGSMVAVNLSVTFCFYGCSSSLGETQRKWALGSIGDILFLWM
jgi:hypothetical protein